MVSSYAIYISMNILTIGLMIETLVKAHKWRLPMPPGEFVTIWLVVVVGTALLVSNTLAWLEIVWRYSPWPK